MSLDFILAITAFIFTAIVQVVGIAFYVGKLDAFKSHIKEDLTVFKEYIKGDIQRLEKKQDKNNCLIERMVVVEQSAKSAHHRLDGIKGS